VESFCEIGDRVILSLNVIGGMCADLKMGMVEMNDYGDVVRVRMRLVMTGEWYDHV